MDLILPGRLCGVIALLDKRRYPVTVVALQNSEVLEMSAAAFDSLMRAFATEPVERRVANLLALLLPKGGSEVRLRRENIAELH